MARTMNESTIFINKMLEGNPDMSWAEAQPKLEKAGFGDVKDTSFANLKSKFRRANGTVSPRRGRQPRVVAPESAGMGIASAMALLKEAYGDSFTLDEVKADIARYTERERPPLVSLIKSQKG